MDVVLSDMLCHSVALEINSRFYALSLPENGYVFVRKQHKGMLSRKIPVLLPKNSRKITKIFSDIKKGYVTTKKNSNFCHLYQNVKGTAVAQWLRCCATNRNVAGSIPAGVSGFFIDTKSYRSHYGPGVDSASKRNEYQEHFLGVKAVGA